MRLVDALLLLGAPDRFATRATEHAIAREFQSNRQLREKYPDQVVPADVRASFEQNVRSQASVIRRSVLTSIGVTTAAIVLGVIVGGLLRLVCGPPPKIAVYLLQAVGAAILLGATLAEVGRKISTWSQNSLPEEVNAFIFRALYVLGTFLFVVTVAWDAT